MQTSMPKVNKIALSIDVEDWFTVRNMRDKISLRDWDHQELRIHKGMDFILDSLKKKNIKATFFILGWIAERCPEMVLKIAKLGHEIACHGYSHTPLDLMKPDEFKNDLTKAVHVIKDITGKTPTGFRAPSFSVTRATSWALPIIKECGLQYDSSIFCTSHPDYGVSEFPRDVTSVGGVLEVPLTKCSFLGAQIPVCGGGYFRLFPYAVTKSAITQELQTRPVIMYFHPWEFDPEQPRVKLPMFKSFRHYVGLNSNRHKFLTLLEDFEFTTIYEIAQKALVNNTVAEFALSPYESRIALSPGSS